MPFLICDRVPVHVALSNNVRDTIHIFSLEDFHSSHIRYPTCSCSLSYPYPPSISTESCYPLSKIKYSQELQACPGGLEFKSLFIELLDGVTSPKQTEATRSGLSLPVRQGRILTSVKLSRWPESSQSFKSTLKSSSGMYKSVRWLVVPSSCRFQLIQCRSSRRTRQASETRSSRTSPTEPTAERSKAKQR